MTDNKKQTAEGTTAPITSINRVVNTLLSAVLIMVALASCGESRAGEMATQQMPSHMQSTEGRYDSARGLITKRGGYFYFSPTRSAKNSKGWLRLNKQRYVSQFAGQIVTVSGYFNYDKNSISVVNLRRVVHARDTAHNTKTSRKP